MPRTRKSAETKQRRSSGGGDALAGRKPGAAARGESALSARESVRKKLPAKKRRPTFEELAGDLIGSVEGPGDLSTNPKHMEDFGRDNRTVRPAAPKTARTKGSRTSDSGRLFVSFWHIALENLPVGSFSHRRIPTQEARDCIALARLDATLSCCSEDDLLAPYRKDRKEDHRKMCTVLGRQFGIALTLRDFMTPPDESGSYTTSPLQFAKVSGGNRLLVVTCMYMAPKRRKRKPAFPWRDMDIDPESVRFHLFEALQEPEVHERVPGVDAPPLSLDALSI